MATEECADAFSDGEHTACPIPGDHASEGIDQINGLLLAHLLRQAYIASARIKSYPRSA